MTMKELLLSIAEEQKQKVGKGSTPKEIWEKIKLRDEESLLNDLGCTPSTLDSAIAEFIKNNPYNSID